MSESSSELIDFRAVLGVLHRRLLPIIVTAALVLLAVAIAYSLQEPKYAATARVAVDRQQSSELVNVDRDQPNITTDSGTVDTEVQVIQSPAVAADVVDRLKLASKPGFGFAEGEAPPRPDIARARAIDTVRNGLSVQREGLSYAISVKYTAGEPTVAADVVNAVVDAYVNGRRNERSQRREKDIKQIGDRLGQLRTDVMEAEAAVARYRAATGMTDLQTSSPSAQAGLSGLNAQLATARAEQAATQARAAAAEGGAAAIQSPVLRELRTEQAKLSAQLTDLKGRYGAEHPARTAVERQLSDIDVAINQELARIRSSSAAEVQAASRATAAIQGAISQTQGRLLAGNNASVRLNELERNAESSRALYQAFLDRYRQNVAAQGTERSNAYVIAMATIPGAPISPNLKLYALAGLIGALIAGLVVAVVLEFMEQGFRSRKELEEALYLPAVGAIPDLASVKEARSVGRTPSEISTYVIENEGSLVAESYRSVRAALRIGREGQLAKTLAISSSLPGEGKTTAAICLARSIARSGLKVVIVDCDVRRRSASRNLVGSVETGVIDVLKSQASLDKALQRDPESGAYMLLQRAVPPQDYDLIASREMKVMLDALSARFDLVILDTAPVLPVADARAIAAMADATMLIVHWRKTSAQVVTRTLRELDQAGAKVLGTLLSQVDIRRAAMVGNDVHYYRPYEAIAA